LETAPELRIERASQGEIGNSLFEIGYSAAVFRMFLRVRAFPIIYVDPRKRLASTALCDDSVVIFRLNMTIDPAISEEEVKNESFLART